jgi:hypothetical protein
MVSMAFSQLIMRHGLEPGALPQATVRLAFGQRATGKLLLAPIMYMGLIYTIWFG